MAKKKQKAPKPHKEDEPVVRPTDPEIKPLDEGKPPPPPPPPK